MPTFDLGGRTAVITGATGAIGSAVLLSNRVRRLRSLPVTGVDWSACVLVFLRRRKPLCVLLT